MTITLVVIGTILCMALFIDLRALSPNRLDAIGMRAEMTVWTIFVLFMLSRAEGTITSAEFVFFLLLIMTRLITCVSYALGHPYKKTQHKKTQR